MTTIRKFRPDIEVLRAIAVIAVIIAHSKLALPGGFIGVDIFFVISGFLITKHLHDEVAKTGTVSLKSFYARRILRIFPASMLVLLLTLLGSFLFLSPLQLINYCWDAFYSGISGINYRLAISGTDYFQSTTTPTPFQHFWSLAVEEQFYLIWPILILLIAKVLIRTPKDNYETKTDKIVNNSLLKVTTGKLSSDIIIPANKNTKSKTDTIKDDLLRLKSINIEQIKNFTLFKTTISFLLILIIAVSLYLSYKITGESQMWAYFGLHTRAWQLAIGALISFNLPLLCRIPNKIASILSWIGFCGLLVGLTLISESTVYPGLWALLPTLSTALIVIAGTNFSQYSFESFFDCKISRWIGKISYSLYLIHWPIFVFVFYQLGENIKVTDRIAVILISLMLAGLSLVLIENPVRFNKELKTSFRETAKIGVFLILLVSTLSFSLQYLQNIIINGNTVNASANATSENQLFQKLKNGLDIKEIPQDLQKPIEQVAKETGSSCIAVEAIKTPSEGAKCKLGDKDAKKTIVLLGDSHANQWVETLDLISQQNNYAFIPFSKAGCSMTDIKHFNPLLKRDYTECYSYREATLAEIEKIQPDIVITTELVYQESKPEIYTKFIEKLQSISKQVVRLTDTPRPTQNIPECIAKNSNNIQKCSFEIKDGENNGGQEKEKENEIAKNLGVKIIDTTKWFCLDITCQAVVNNIIVYNDDSHISDSYSVYLSSILNKKLFNDSFQALQKVIDGANIINIPEKLVLPLEKAPNDSFGDTCKDNNSSIVPDPKNICTFGNTNSPKTIVLIGDSHAQQWIKALDQIATKNNYKMITFIKSSCTMSDINLYDLLNKKDYPECTAWRKEVLTQVEKIRPNVIISSEILHSNSTVEKYSELMIKLKSMSDKVIKIIDNPRSEFSIPECLVKNPTNVQKCTYNVENAIFNKEEADKELVESQKLGIPMIQTLQWFCTDKVCPPIIDNIIVYYDNGHVSNTYSNYISDLMEEKILKAYPAFQNK